MTRFLKSMLVAAATAACAGGAMADVAIDDFTAFQGTVDLVAAGGQGMYNQLCDATIALGGCREIYVEKTAGPNGTLLPPTNQVTASAQGGVFSFTSGSGTNAGFAVIRWDGAAQLAFAGAANTIEGGTYNTNAVGNAFMADMYTFGTAFKFTYQADLAFQVTVQAWDTAGNFVSGTFNGLGGQVQQSDTLAFDDFIGIIDFHQLSGLQVIINPGGGTVSLDLDFSGVVGTQVPEPASIALVGAALLGIGAARSRRRRS